MKKYKKAKKLILLFLLIIGFGCKTRLTEPETEDKYLSISDITNILWTLEACDSVDQQLNIDSYLTFHLVYDTTEFWGDDGCNKYTGIYYIQNDSILLNDFSITCMGCWPTTSFPINFFFNPHKLFIFKDSLQIISDNWVYHLKSDFTKSIEKSGLVNTWQLIFSSDPDYEIISYYQYVTNLIFDNNRCFNLNFVSTFENDSTYNYTTGIYGIKNDDSFMFYHRYGGSRRFKARRFRSKILNSTIYNVENDTLTLSNLSDNTIFRFEKLEYD